MQLEHVTFTGPPLTDGDLLARLPANLAGLLRQINGFIQFHGGLHVRGACHEPAWHSLRDAWDGEAAFWRLYQEQGLSHFRHRTSILGKSFLKRSISIILRLSKTGC